MVNALFNEVELLKNERKRQMELINLKNERIIDLLEIDQEILVYKNDEPHVLMVEMKDSTKFDRAELASNLGVSQNFLTIPNVAELVEENRITSADLENYWYEDVEPKIKVKKATKKDVDRLNQTDIYDFIE